MERSNSDVHPREILMLGLSVYVLAALAAEAALPLSPATKVVLQYADTGICAIFLADFFTRLAQAQDRKAFLKWGWIDLLSSIPTLDAARAGRAVRVVRILRVLRGAHSVKRLGTFLLRRRAEAALTTAALVTILMIVFASIAILEFEAAVQGANIRTPADALWWAASTVTTVGYGDRYPVTAEGRVVAAFLMTAGIACFGTFTGFVASWLLAPATEKADELAGIRDQLDTVLRALDALRATRPAAADRSLPAACVERGAPRALNPGLREPR